MNLHHSRTRRIAVAGIAMLAPASVFAGDSAVVQSTLPVVMNTSVLLPTPALLSGMGRTAYAPIGGAGGFAVYSGGQLQERVFSPSQNAGIQSVQPEFVPQPPGTETAETLLTAIRLSEQITEPSGGSGVILQPTARIVLSSGITRNSIENAIRPRMLVASKSASILPPPLPPPEPNSIQ